MHFATCEDYGKEGGTCPGCAPELARDGALICDRCFRRIRRHLDNAPDLVGRLRSLSDPMAAAVYDRVRVSGGGSEAPAPTPPDLIDASDDVMRTLRTWAVYVDPRSGIIGGMPAGAGALGAYDYARRCANVILGDFERLANRRDDILQLAEAVLDRHPSDAEGIRSFWSIVDAVSRYRLERPDAAIVIDAREDEDGEEMTSSVPEWRDRLITRSEAERERYAASGATLRRWVAKELIAPRAVTYGPMGKVTWFRESELLALRAEMDARVGRPRKAKA
ncbi:hypothetical protein [Microbacterium sp. cx-59]|uniref:hypothetical protein n=1 Tax=Microbacterium sp. cx-59 TaxID=2891207 RepID=UPI001E2B93E9|nr:hypothetical protein [Microbacterium sp. cx-59]MCC4906950.1 hypothetical protein [Microbacterium sp. cx-59]